MRKARHAITEFKCRLSVNDGSAISAITTPAKIQFFLDDVAYSTVPDYRAPITVLRERVAHCYDGAVFAAAMLAYLGYPPLIVNMFPNSRDDEHLVAVFQKNGRWGAVGQSNFVGLRYREPVYASIRELMMSYFEQFYNVAGEKTLRSYCNPLDLAKFDRHLWMTDASAMDVIAERLERMPKIQLVSPAMVRALSRVDRRSYEAGLQGSVKAGLFEVESEE
jgi:hypothetical protein